MAFPLRVPAKSVWPIAIRIPAIIPTEIRKVLVQRLDFDAPERFQVDGWFHNGKPMGAPAFSPALFLVALGGLKFFWRLLRSAVAVNLAVQSEAMNFPDYSIAAYPFAQLGGDSGAAKQVAGA